VSGVTEYPKRLIEVDLPIKRISAHARREKSIRHGHISTLHIWWARRPLAACRAIICAALWPDPADPLCPIAFIQTARSQMQTWADRHIGLVSAESYHRFVRYQKDKTLLHDVVELRHALLDFIADFSNWDNSVEPEYLETGRSLTHTAHQSLGGAPGTKPLVVDPFAGGGSIPLEALRVGADSFASDLNPVPVLLNKVTLEYIPRFSQQLAEEFQKWGKWIKRKADKELAKYYPAERDGSRPVAYLWARTILSEAPSEDEVPIEVPVLRSMWLSSKAKRRFALRWRRDKRGHIRTEEAEVAYADGTVRTVRRPLLEVFQPTSQAEVETGTSAGGAVTCPITGFTTPVERIREQLKVRAGGGADARLLCVVTTSKSLSGRTYRLPTTADLEAVKAAERELRRRVKRHDGELALIPDGKLNHLRGFFNVVLYGMTTWGALFTPRQALSLSHIVEIIKGISHKFKDKELGVAVQTCLAMALDRCADKCASVVVWNIPAEKVEHVFGRQALPMVWDFAEADILSDIGWAGACEWVQKVIEHNAGGAMQAGSVTRASATSQPLPDDTAEAVITDPPYYAAIPYADLSDFFYSWLKRSVGNVHHDLFRLDLAPKDDECVQLAHRAAMYRHKDSGWFEEMMTKACAESRRITKPAGISVFVFANKETSGWEAMLNALIASGWVITASWPIDTERQGRLRAMDSAALASSVHLVCRPRESPDGSVLHDEIGDWRDVLHELPRRIGEWMPRLSEEGVVGADAIFACLGPALEIYSRYTAVEKASGEQVKLREYLEHIWAAVAKEALNMIFEGADATGFQEDARLTAIWFWVIKASANGNGVHSEVDIEEEPEGSPDSDGEKTEAGKKPLKGYTMEYDAVRKLAQGLGINLQRLSQPGGIVVIKGNWVMLNSVTQRERHLFGRQVMLLPALENGRPHQRRVKAPVAELKTVQQRQTHLYDPAPIPASDLAQPFFPGLEMEDNRTILQRLLDNGSTMLDRLHQAMLLFAHSYSSMLRPFLQEAHLATDPQFWLLAQSLSALYPKDSNEKRWVDGVLARKKSLGF